MVLLEILPNFQTAVYSKEICGPQIPKIKFFQLYKTRVPEKMLYLGLIVKLIPIVDILSPTLVLKIPFKLIKFSKHRLESNNIKQIWGHSSESEPQNIAMGSL